MNWELMKENISSKKTFKVECQRCKCKKSFLECSAGTSGLRIGSLLSDVSPLSTNRFV